MKIPEKSGITLTNFIFLASDVPYSENGRGGKTTPIEILCIPERRVRGQPSRDSDEESTTH